MSPLLLSATTYDARPASLRTLGQVCPLKTSPVTVVRLYSCNTPTTSTATAGAAKGGFHSVTRQLSRARDSLTVQREGSPKMYARPGTTVGAMRRDWRLCAAATSCMKAKGYS